MADETLIYRIPGAVWSLELSNAAVEKLTAYAQRCWWSTESVGQLYSANFQPDIIRVDAVTKLQSTWSSHTRVRLDLPAMNRERAEFFQNGLHCLGFWHTHPEPIPTPSQEDITMAADHAFEGLDLFSGIVFVIVGTAPAPDGLGVWVHDGTKLWQAIPVRIV